MMTKDDYTRAVAGLNCKSMAEAGRLLGITPRQSQYYATGHTSVPATIEYLLLAYLEMRMLRNAMTDAWSLLGRRNPAAEAEEMVEQASLWPRLQG